MSALAFVFRYRAVLIDGCDRRRIFAAVRAEDADRIVSFSLSRLGFLCPEAVQDIKDLTTLLQRCDDVILVFAAAVHVRLIPVIHGDPELVDGSHELLLEVVRVVGLLCAERVRDILVGQSDVTLEFVLRIDLGDVHRDLTESVIFIPGKEEAGLLAFSLQCLTYEQSCRDVTEVTDMDRPGRADTGSTYVLFLIRVSVDDFVCNLI